jgi:hypothetical protein
VCCSGECGAGSASERALHPDASPCPRSLSRSWLLAPLTQCHRHRHHITILSQTHTQTTHLTRHRSVNPPPPLAFLCLLLSISSCLTRCMHTSLGICKRERDWEREIERGKRRERVIEREERLRGTECDTIRIILLRVVTSLYILHTYVCVYSCIYSFLVLSLAGRPPSRVEEPVDLDPKVKAQAQAAKSRKIASRRTLGKEKAYR